MAKFVLAGRADCGAFARAEMLADRLAATLPEFRVHKLPVSPEDWPGWLGEQCSLNGWSHTSSPLVWRELVDRGGRGLYLGGLAEFEEYTRHYYNVSPDTESESESKIAAENLDTLQTQQLAEKTAPKVAFLRVCITNASSPSAYHLASLVARGRAFGEEQLVSLQLLVSPSEMEHVQGTAMELVDLASPVLRSVKCTASVEEAFTSADAVFILDYPYQGVCNTVVEGESPGGEETSQEEQKSLSETAEEQKSLSETAEQQEEQKLLSETAEQQASDHDGGSSGEPTTAHSQGSKLTDDDPTTSQQLSEAALLFKRYARILDFCAQKEVKVVVSSQYANTAAAIMVQAASSLPPRNIIAAPTLAEQQAKSILAGKLGLNSSDVEQVAIWGRTCGPVLADLAHTWLRHFQGAIVGPDPFSLPVNRCVFEPEWLQKEFPSQLASRHGRFAGYHSSSSSGCTPLAEAVGLAGLMGGWLSGGESVLSWRSVGVVSQGEYGVPEGVVFSMPVRCEGGEWGVAGGLEISEIQVGIAQQVAVIQRELAAATTAIEDSERETHRQT